MSKTLINAQINSEDKYMVELKKIGHCIINTGTTLLSKAIIE